MKTSDILSSILQSARDESGGSMGDLTVLSAQRDPYRLGTPTHQRNADWLAEAIVQVGITSPIHLRGLHYRLVGSVLLPDGTAYKNDDDTWLFLSEKAAMAARFLGTVDFDLIRDNRNDAPSIWCPDAVPLTPMIQSGFEFELPSVEDLTPAPVLRGTACRQAWRLAIIGEKSGLYDLIRPEAERYEATLALPNGEISTTMCETLIRDAAADGRPLAVIYLADCDPAGHQMCVSFARKAQAIIDIRYPDVRLRVHPIALTPDQSRDWGLPSTPLKETEKRADRWMDAMGIAQTEIDAAIGRTPDELVSVVRKACRAYYDPGLAEEGRARRLAWEREATEAMASQLGAGVLEQMQIRIGQKLEELSEVVDEITEATAIDPEELGITLPPAPEPLIGTRSGGDLEPLIDTDDGFESVTAALKARKNY